MTSELRLTAPEKKMCAEEVELLKASKMLEQHAVRGREIKYELENRLLALWPYKPDHDPNCATLVTLIEESEFTREPASSRDSISTVRLKILEIAGKIYRIEQAKMPAKLPVIDDELDRLKDSLSSNDLQSTVLLSRLTLRWRKWTVQCEQQQEQQQIERVRAEYTRIRQELQVYDPITNQVVDASGNLILIRSRNDGRHAWRHFQDKFNTEIDKIKAIHDGLLKRKDPEVFKKEKEVLLDLCNAYGSIYRKALEWEQLGEKEAGRISHYKDSEWRDIKQKWRFLQEHYYLRETYPESRLSSAISTRKEFRALVALFPPFQEKIQRAAKEVTHQGVLHEIAEFQKEIIGIRQLAEKASATVDKCILDTSRELAESYARKVNEFESQWKNFDYETLETLDLLSENDWKKVDREMVGLHRWIDSIQDEKNRLQRIEKDCFDRNSVEQTKDQPDYDFLQQLTNCENRLNQLTVQANIRIHDIKAYMAKATEAKQRAIKAKFRAKVEDWSKLFAARKEAWEKFKMVSLQYSEMSLTVAKERKKELDRFKELFKEIQHSQISKDQVAAFSEICTQIKQVAIQREEIFKEIANCKVQIKDQIKLIIDRDCEAVVKQAANDFEPIKEQWKKYISIPCELSKMTLETVQAREQELNEFRKKITPIQKQLKLYRADSTDLYSEMETILDEITDLEWDVREFIKEVRKKEWIPKNEESIKQYRDLEKEFEKICDASIAADTEYFKTRDENQKFSVFIAREEPLRSLVDALQQVRDDLNKYLGIYDDNEIMHVVDEIDDELESAKDYLYTTLRIKGLRELELEKEELYDEEHRESLSQALLQSDEIPAVDEGVFGDETGLTVGGESISGLARTSTAATDNVAVEAAVVTSGAGICKVEERSEKISNEDATSTTATDRESAVEAAVVTSGAGVRMAQPGDEKRSRVTSRTNIALEAKNDTNDDTQSSSTGLYEVAVKNFLRAYQKTSKESALTVLRQNVLDHMRVYDVNEEQALDILIQELKEKYSLTNSGLGLL